MATITKTTAGELNITNEQILNNSILMLVHKSKARPDQWSADFAGDLKLVLAFPCGNDTYVILPKKLIQEPVKTLAMARSRLKTTVTPLFDEVKKQLIKGGAPEEVIREQEEFFKLNPQYFVRSTTLQNNVYGAAALLNIAEIVNKFEEDYFVILPSSIHEFLLIPKKKDITKIEAENMSEMVRQVNAEAVQAEEILSDHAYFYQKGKGFIKLPEVKTIE